MTKAAKKQNEVSFDCSDEDQDFIHQIVTRAKELGLISRKYTGMTCSMDITATHCNGNPLRLRDLLYADDLNFIHDVCGICRHLNRDTGELMNFFSPRFSVPSAA